MYFFNIKNTNIIYISNSSIFKVKRNITQSLNGYDYLSLALIHLDKRLNSENLPLIILSFDILNISLKSIFETSLPKNNNFIKCLTRLQIKLKSAVI